MCQSEEYQTATRIYANTCAQLDARAFLGRAPDRGSSSLPLQLRSLMATWKSISSSGRAPPRFTALAHQGQDCFGHSRGAIGSLWIARLTPPTVIIPDGEGGVNNHEGRRWAARPGIELKAKPTVALVQLT